MAQILIAFLVGVGSSLVAGLILGGIRTLNASAPTFSTSTAGITVLCLAFVQFPALGLTFLISGHWQIGLGVIFSGMSCAMIGAALMSLAD